MFEIYEYTPDDVREDATPVFGRIHPDDLQRVSELIFESARTLKQFFCELRVILPGQGLRWRYSTAVPQRMDDGSTLWHGIIYDITDRKLAESALLESEKLYRNLVETSLDGVYKSSHAGKFVEVNPAMVRMLGYETKEELMAIDIKTQLYFEPADRESLIQQELLEETGVYRLRKKDGSEIWVEDHAWYDFDEAGNILFHEGILRDITDRKIAEDEIRLLNETLELRIAERTKQLENVNRELAFHVDELEQFAYVSNHDLNEPLRTLTQFTQLLQDEYSGKLDADGNKYVEFIYNSGLRMKELVTGLFNYTLLGRDRIITAIDCNVLVNAVLNDLNHSIMGSNAVITVQELPTVNGHETELRLLFQNLIANALKFHKNNESPEINISAVNREKEWLFSIQDNGIGIEPKHKDKIFIIFQRLHKRNEFSGTGIGLAHCKKVVELHGGKIWVESEPGAGSTFKFTIPVV
jgi:PAS domain S-box-containing protein